MEAFIESSNERSWPTGLKISTEGLIDADATDSFWRTVQAELRVGRNVTVRRDGTFNCWNR